MENESSNERFSLASLVILFCIKTLILAYLSGLLSFLSPLLIPSKNLFYQWIIFFTLVFSDLFVVVADNLNSKGFIARRSFFIFFELLLSILVLVSFFLVSWSDFLGEHKIYFFSFWKSRNDLTNFSIFLSLASLCLLFNRDDELQFDIKKQKIPYIQSLSSVIFIALLLYIKNSDTYNGWSIGYAGISNFKLGYYINVIFIFCCLELIVTLLCHYSSFEKSQRHKLTDGKYPLHISVFTNLFIIFWGFYSFKPNREHPLTWDYWVFAGIVLLFNLALSFKYLQDKRDTKKVVFGLVFNFLTCVFSVVVAFRDVTDQALLIILFYMAVIVFFPVLVESTKTT